MRLDLTLVAGYRPEEFLMFGKFLDDRATAMDSIVGTLRWAGRAHP